MSIKSKSLAVLGLGAACAVCCTPLIAPLVFGAGAVGFGSSFGLGELGLSLDQSICGGTAIAVISAIAFFAWRTQQAAKRARTCAYETTCSTKTCGPVKAA